MLSIFSRDRRVETIERVSWVACQQTCISSYSVSLLFDTARRLGLTGLDGEWLAAPRQEPRAERSAVEVGVVVGGGQACEAE
jgi:hypothetical protein